MDTVDLPAGATLIEAGAPGDAAYILLQGELEVTSPDGTFLARDLPGALVGEQALLPGAEGTRNATVVATELCKLLRVEKRLFTELYAARAERRERVEEDADAKTRNRLSRLSGPFRRLLEASERRTYAEGEGVIHEGDPADGLHLILAGQAEVVTHRDGEPVHLTTVYPGQCFGELATLQDIPRTASVVAREGLRTAFVPAAEARALHAEHTDLELFLNSLLRTYTLPRRGALHQRSVFVDGRACIETVYALDDGRSLTAFREPEGRYRIHTEGAAVHKSFEIAAGTTVSLDDQHRIVRIEDDGGYDDIGGLQELALQGGALSVQQRRGLRKAAREAKLAAPDAIICRCLNLDRTTLQAAIDGGACTLATLQGATGCGTVCGSCVKTTIPAMLAEAPAPTAPPPPTALVKGPGRLPRMPKLIPWLGNFSFSRDPVGFQERGHARLGPVFGAHLMGVDFVFVDPRAGGALSPSAWTDALPGLSAAAACKTLVGRWMGDALIEAPQDLSVPALPNGLAERLDALLAPLLCDGNEVDLLTVASDAVTTVLCALRHAEPDEAPFIDELARLLDVIHSDDSAMGSLMPLRTASVRKRMVAREQLVRVLGLETASAFIAAHPNATRAVVSAIRALGDDPGKAERLRAAIGAPAPWSLDHLRGQAPLHAVLAASVEHHGGGAVWRKATAPVSLGGVDIPEGALVGTVMALAPAGGSLSGRGAALHDEAFGRADPGLPEVAAEVALAHLLRAANWTVATPPRRWLVPVVPGMQRPDGAVRMAVHPL